MPTSFVSLLMMLFAIVSALIGLNQEGYAAHGLEVDAGEYAVNLYHTAAKYLMWHVFGLIFLALLYDRWVDLRTRVLIGLAALTFALGIVTFSGGMYRVPFGGTLGPVIFGAVAFMVGWGLMGLGVISGWWAGRAASSYS